MSSCSTVFSYVLQFFTSPIVVQMHIFLQRLQTGCCCWRHRKTRVYPLLSKRWEQTQRDFFFAVLFRKLCLGVKSFVLLKFTGVCGSDINSVCLYPDIRTFQKKNSGGNSSDGHKEPALNKHICHICVDVSYSHFTDRTGWWWWWWRWYITKRCCLTDARLDLCSSTPDNSHRLFPEGFTHLFSAELSLNCSISLLFS